MKRRTWIVAGGVSAVVSLGIVYLGQSSATATADPQFLSESEASVRYDEVITDFEYELPAGVGFPRLQTEYTLARSAHEDVIYQPGAVDARAYFFWQCSWMNQAVSSNAAGDAMATTDALTQLAQWDKTDFFKKHVVEEGGSWIEDVVVPATRGDFAPMQASYDAGCSPSDELKGVSQ